MSEFNQEASKITKSDTPINPNVHNLKNTMCFKTWNDIIISLPSRTVKWCCKTQYTEEQLKAITFDAETLTLDFLINHPILQQRKYDLSGGTRSPDCAMCWKTEDDSGHSVRTQYNKHFEPTWKRRFEKASNHPKKAVQFHQQAQKHDGFKFIEIELTNKCNMACAYCWEGLSSRWQKEVKRPMPDTDDALFDKVVDILNEYWETHLRDESDYVNFSLLGGEPFFTDHMFKFLDEFITKVNDTKREEARTIVTVTTNLNFTKKRFEQFSELVARTPNIIYDMQISNEATGRRAELIRWGSNFDKFDATLGDFIELAKKQENIVMGFGCAHNSLSLPYVKDYFVYLDNKLQTHDYDRHVHMHTNWVDFPSHLSVAMTPKRFLSDIDDAIDYMDNKFKTELVKKDVYISSLKTMRDIVDSDISDEMRENAYHEFTRLEQRRGISFAEHFPHYSELIKNPDK